ncbi:Hypothetical protein LUCI_1464 [Lucifera butyrica]|uniref:Uncharacterized protein n=1 Tax=Lucifera butyrica TaxID=1351585 RepID=A0A498R106_9FIRM|nr:Hypothetical protein LUCI_1464 [Lucifera butyrica]
MDFVIHKEGAGILIVMFFYKLDDMIEIIGFYGRRYHLIC